MTRTVIAATRLLSSETVSVFASPAAPPSFEGRFEAALLSFWVMSNFWLSSLELRVVVGPVLEVLDVAGQLRRQGLDLADDRPDHVEHQEHEQRDERDVHDQDREPPRQRAAAYPDALHETHRGGEREREEDRGERPPQGRCGSPITDRASSTAIAITSSAIATTLTTAQP